MVGRWEGRQCSLAALPVLCPQYAPEGVQKILIGNKADEEQKRQVGREQGQQVSGASWPNPSLGFSAASQGQS